MRVAFISVFNTPCGIATYNQNLVAELSKIVQLKVFAEYNGQTSDDLTKLEYCWDRKEYPKYELIDAIDDYHPDAIIFSHEYGFFPKAYQFTSLVSYFKFRGYKVYTIFHSVYQHLDKTVQESSSPNIIVHSNAAKDCLVAKGLKADNITVIQHGSQFIDEGKLLPPLWNTWGNDHTLFHPGFLFEYKGHSRMLDILAKLKDKYPDIHYIVQASENPLCKDEHERVYQQLLKQAEDLDVVHNLTINRGFVETEVLLSYIRTVKCCVLPYKNNGDHEVRATSGIARLILATETPLVTSNVPLFDDVKDVVLYSKDDEEIAKNIEDVFDGRVDIADQNAKRLNFISQTQWDKMAKKIVNLLLDY